MYPSRQSTAYAVTNEDYVIDNYLRLSREDDARDESNSIINQRAMIRDYIFSRDEFRNAKVIDYIDDGISGSHTDREAYQRLIRDIENGAVGCVIVKDLSR
ncbi:MAG: recombinase family protein, partial [Eubacterium sp.]|nr:recombinase family protein [Eubacterium sp.]